MNPQTSHIKWNPCGTGLPVQISSHLPSRACQPPSQHPPTFFSFSASLCPYLNPNLLKLLPVQTLPVPCPQSLQYPVCWDLALVIFSPSSGFHSMMFGIAHCSWLLWFFIFPAMLTFSQTRPVSSHMLFIFFRRNFRDWDIVSDQWNVTIDLVNESGSQSTVFSLATWFQLTP